MRVNRFRFIKVLAAIVLSVFYASAVFPQGGGQGKQKTKVDFGRVILLPNNSDVPTQNGSDLLDAVATIGTSGPCADPPTATSPCQISLGPGTADIGTNILVIPSHTSLVGAGQGISFIEGSSSTAVIETNPLTENIQLRDLTVIFTGTRVIGFPNRVVSISTTSNFRLERVTSEYAGTIGGGTAVYIGGSSGVLVDVTGIGSSTTGGGTGISVATGPSNVQMFRVRGVGSVAGEVSALAGQITNVAIYDSVFEAGIGFAFWVSTEGGGIAQVDMYNSHLAGKVGGNTGVLNIYSSQIFFGGAEAIIKTFNVNLHTTLLDGTASPAAVINCVFVYDSAFQPHVCNNAPPP